MTRWLASSVQTNGIQMHYYRSAPGGEKPQLILAHGLTDSGLCWQPIAEILVETYDCIMPDARGHGFSSAPASGYTNTEHAADYAGLIEALGLERPIILGHSMGAGTAAQLAASYPALVRGVLLEDPPWWPQTHVSTAEERAARAEEWRGTVRESNASTLATLLQRGHEENPSWPEAEFDGWATAKQRSAPVAIDYALYPSTPWWDVVPQIQCPSLLIIGDTDQGALVARDLAPTIAESNDKLQVAYIAGAGHSIRREQPQAYLDVVQAFLAGIGE